VLAGDLSDFSLASKAVARANERWGRLDGLIVNHGSLEPVAKIADVGVEEWRKGFDGNVFSALALVSSIEFQVFVSLVFFPNHVRVHSRHIISPRCSRCLYELEGNRQ
jgi:NAD(P)-dependent dehydrogenase (short-subunit alcohol dehydrogenase family)